MMRAVPLGCVAADTTFYHKACAKAGFPVVAIALLWCSPLISALRGKPTQDATKRAKKLALLLLELMLPSITTSLVQIFVCDSYGNGDFLRAALTIPCDRSAQRNSWIIFAAFALVAYVLGGATCVRHHAFFYSRLND